MKLHVLIGLPGAGKTTLAMRWITEAPERRKRVSRDDLRVMENGYLYGHCDEDAITETIVQASISYLSRGYDVIWDATNLTPMERTQPEGVAKQIGDVELLYTLFDTSVETCIARQMTRPETRRVPTDVIEQMFDMLDLSDIDPMKLTTVGESSHVAAAIA